MLTREQCLAQAEKALMKSLEHEAQPGAPEDKAVIRSSYAASARAWIELSREAS